METLFQWSYFGEVRVDINKGWNHHSSRKFSQAITRGHQPVTSPAEQTLLTLPLITATPVISEFFPPSCDWRSTRRISNFLSQWLGRSLGDKNSIYKWTVVTRAIIRRPHKRGRGVGGWRGCRSLSSHSYWPLSLWRIVSDADCIGSSAAPG